MEAQAIEITEIETLLEETMSLNHSRLTYRLSVLLSDYEEQYDIMPELELELVTGRSKPDVAIFPKLIYDWEEDIIRYTQPPITAIEILSPTQAFDSLTSKIRKIYFPAGVRSAWLVVPSIKAIHLFFPGKPVSIITDGVVYDPVCQVSLDIDSIFR